MPLPPIASYAKAPAITKTALLGANGKFGKQRAALQQHQCRKKRA
ncbi:hypothetical protein [Comamonas aquatica]|uniref:Uncharacterized protein n=1 Tax=Comamonas aquatica TaxID=225991 RepID=A0AA42HRV0_9BURK|nr:hypothetical protein [Comamonas aquatica]MDH0363429.1 hypothetical protein [Comamonas aquatica]